MDKTGWSTTQAEDCALRARKRAGAGWTLLGRDLQAGLISAEVLRIVFRGVGVIESVSPTQILDLLNDALRIGGID
jgi:hypothetical protein